MTSPAFGRFFLPGPTDVHPDVLAAMERPMIGHRSSAMEQLMGGMAAPLGRLFRTSRPVLVGTASATGFMEMAVRNGVARRALSLVNGAFSERFADMVGASGKECIRLEVPLGSAVEPDLLRDALRRTPVDAVTLVHSETSTGVLQDVAALAAVVREFDNVLLLVDAVTSLAGSPVEHDRWGLDFTFTGSQKALALPPGLALGVASERMLERAKTLHGRGLYFDLVSFEEATRKSQPTNTPASHCFTRSRRSSPASSGKAASRPAGNATTRCAGGWRRGASRTASAMSPPKGDAAGPCRVSRCPRGRNRRTSLARCKRRAGPSAAGTGP